MTQLVRDTFAFQTLDGQVIKVRVTYHPNARKLAQEKAERSATRKARERVDFLGTLSRRP